MQARGGNLSSRSGLLEEIENIIGIVGGNDAIREEQPHPAPLVIPAQVDGSAGVGENLALAPEFRHEEGTGGNSGGELPRSHPIPFTVRLVDGATVPMLISPRESMRNRSNFGVIAQRTVNAPLPAKFAESMMIPEEWAAEARWRTCEPMVRGPPSRDSSS